MASSLFHMADIFFLDDLDDQVHVFNSLFFVVLNEHAPLRRVKIKLRPNPYITPEIRQLMRTRDKWHKSAIKKMTDFIGMHIFLSVRRSSVRFELLR